MSKKVQCFDVREGFEFAGVGDIPFTSDFVSFLTSLSASFECASEERVYLLNIRGGSDWSLVALAKVVKINFALL